MSQPIWKRLFCTDHEQVFVDQTGVYAPEMEIAEEIGDGNYYVYRFSLDRLKTVTTEEGSIYLVSFEYAETWPHPIHQYDEWFHKDLSKVAESCGTTYEDLRNDLCSENVHTRAAAYPNIGLYHGLDNLDSYPTTLNEDALNKRWS